MANLDAKQEFVVEYNENQIYSLQVCSVNDFIKATNCLAKNTWIRFTNTNWCQRLLPLDLILQSLDIAKMWRSLMH